MKRHLRENIIKSAHMSFMVQNTGTKHNVCFCPSKFCLQAVTCSDFVAILWPGHYSVSECLWVFLWLGNHCVPESFHLVTERNNCSLQQHLNQLASLQPHLISAVMISGILCSCRFCKRSVLLSSKEKSPKPSQILIYTGVITYMSCTWDKFSQFVLTSQIQL